MERVFIASCGLVKVGKLKEKGIGDLMAEASLQAMRQRPELIPDRVIVGNMFSGVGSRQEHLGAYLSTLLGLGNIPAYKVEAACGSGGVAVHNAYLAIKSGESSAVLVTGVEKMTDLDVNEATSALAMADNQEFGASLGATFTSLNALTYRMYLDRYAAKPEELAEFPVLSHKNALNSPHAMFKKMIQVEDVVNSPFPRIGIRACKATKPINLLLEKVRIYRTYPQAKGLRIILDPLYHPIRDVPEHMYRYKRGYPCKLVDLCRILYLLPYVPCRTWLVENSEPRPGISIAPGRGL
ncbi:MAG: beta-ketoacyl synthase N-terminal-like domain-containing protein, partial [Conexivisphaerales archaeon]